MNIDQSPSALFQRLLADEWDFRMREDPLFATFIGDHRYNDCLPALAEADYARRLDGMVEFQGLQKEIDPSALSPDVQLNYDIFADYLDKQIAELRFRAYRMPISKLDGYHALFPQLPQYLPFRTLSDYDNYLARLSAFPRLADDLIDVMRAGLRDGQVPPRVTLDTVDDQLRAHIVIDRLGMTLLFPAKLDRIARICTQRSLTHPPLNLPLQGEVRWGWV